MNANKAKIISKIKESPKTQGEKIQRLEDLILLLLGKIEELENEIINLKR